MLFSTRAEYGVRLMVELGRQEDGAPVALSAVAESERLPLSYLEHLVAKLRKAGLVESQRGAHGGYRLGRPADRIEMLEVVQALDGKVGQEADEAGGIWAEGVTALRKVFGQTTIAEVARREAEESGSGMYFI